MLLFGFSKEVGVYLGARLHAIQLVKAIFSTGPKPQGVSTSEPPALRQHWRTCCLTSTSLMEAKKCVRVFSSEFSELCCWRFCCFLFSSQTRLTRLTKEMFSGWRRAVLPDLFLTLIFVCKGEVSSLIMI